MGKHMEIASLDILIKAVQNYREELLANKKILVNAANVCDAAMGSDAIVKKHIAQLNEALAELDKTAELAASVAEELMKDRQKAIDIVED
jgi:serine phosphatase RsbU (regulator of sigma subunit)